MKKNIRFLVLQHTKVPGFVSVTNRAYPKTTNPSKIKENHMKYNQYKVIGVLSKKENDKYLQLDDNNKLKFLQDKFPKINITSVPITDMYLYNKTLKTMNMLRVFNKKSTLLKENTLSQVAIIKKIIEEKKQEIKNLKIKLKSLIKK